MTYRISDCIARYNLARAHLNHVISSGYDNDFEKLSAADVALSESFDAVLKSQPENQSERMERLEFLLEEVSSCSDGNSLVVRLVNQIRDDVHSLAPSSDKPVLVVSN